MKIPATKSGDDPANACAIAPLPAVETTESASTSARSGATPQRSSTTKNTAMRPP